jgi:type III secretion control protein HpaP
MNDFYDRPLRIIAAELSQSERHLIRQAAESAGFDYAALAERARQQREARAAARRQRTPASAVTRGSERAASAAATAVGAAQRPGPPILTQVIAGPPGDDDVVVVDDADEADEPAAAARFTDSSFSEDIMSATWEAVEELSQVKQSFSVLTATLAREIAAFCADPAISQAGHWEARIPLDQRIFEQTTLYLQLSQFKLALRFDSADPATRQLLSDHVPSLERELKKLMMAWGEPRDIEITVW